MVFYSVWPILPGPPGCFPLRPMTSMATKPERYFSSACIRCPSSCWMTIPLPANLCRAWASILWATLPGRFHTNHYAASKNVLAMNLLNCWQKFLISIRISRKTLYLKNHGILIDRMNGLKTKFNLIIQHNRRPAQTRFRKSADCTGRLPAQTTTTMSHYRMADDGYLSTQGIYDPSQRPAAKSVATAV